MIFCQSVSAVSVVSTLIGGENTQNLNSNDQICFNFLHSQAVGMLKQCSHTSIVPS